MRRRKIKVGAMEVAGAKRHVRLSAARGDRWPGKMGMPARAAKVTRGWRKVTATLKGMRRGTWSAGSCRVYWEQIAQGVRKAQAKEEERRRKDEERRREDEEDRQTIQAIQEMIENEDKERLRRKEYRDKQDNEHEIQVTALQVQVTIADQGRQEAQEKAQLYQQEIKVTAKARRTAEDRAAEAEEEVEALQRRVRFLERARDGALNRAATTSAVLGGMEREQDNIIAEKELHRQMAKVKEEKAARWRKRARAAEKLLREGRRNGSGAGQQSRSEAGGPGVGCSAVEGWITVPAHAGTGHGGDNGGEPGVGRAGGETGETIQGKVSAGTAEAAEAAKAGAAKEAFGNLQSYICSPAAEGAREREKREKREGRQGEKTSTGVAER